MTELEKMLLAFLNRRNPSKFFVFKLDLEKDGLYLGFAYPHWHPKMGNQHDKTYLKIDKNEFRIWKINQILKNLD